MNSALDSKHSDATTPHDELPASPRPPVKPRQRPKPSIDQTQENENANKTSTPSVQAPIGSQADATQSDAQAEATKSASSPSGVKSRSQRQNQFQPALNRSPTQPESKPEPHSPTSPTAAGASRSLRASQPSPGMVAMRIAAATASIQAVTQSAMEPKLKLKANTLNPTSNQRPTAPVSQSHSNSSNANSAGFIAAQQTMMQQMPSISAAAFAGSKSVNRNTESNTAAETPAASASPPSPVNLSAENAQPTHNEAQATLETNAQHDEKETDTSSSNDHSHSHSSSDQSNASSQPEIEPLATLANQSASELKNDQSSSQPQTQLDNPIQVVQPEESPLEQRQQQQQPQNPIEMAPTTFLIQADSAESQSTHETEPINNQNNNHQSQGEAISEALLAQLSRESESQNRHSLSVHHAPGSKDGVTHRRSHTDTEGGASSRHAQISANSNNNRFEATPEHSSSETAHREDDTTFADAQTIQSIIDEDDNDALGSLMSNTGGGGVTGGNSSNNSSNNANQSNWGSSLKGNSRQRSHTVSNFDSMQNSIKHSNNSVQRSSRERQQHTSNLSSAFHAPNSVAAAGTTKQSSEQHQGGDKFPLIEEEREVSRETDMDEALDAVSNLPTHAELIGAQRTSSPVKHSSSSTNSNATSASPAPSGSASVPPSGALLMPHHASSHSFDQMLAEYTQSVHLAASQRNSQALNTTGGATSRNSFAPQLPQASISSSAGAMNLHTTHNLISTHLNGTFVSPHHKDSTSNANSNSPSHTNTTTNNNNNHNNKGSVAMSSSAMRDSAASSVVPPSGVGVTVQHSASMSHTSANSSMQPQLRSSQSQQQQQQQQLQSQSPVKKVVLPRRAGSSKDMFTGQFHGQSRISSTQNARQGSPNDQPQHQQQQEGFGLNLAPHHNHAVNKSPRTSQQKQQADNGVAHSTTPTAGSTHSYEDAMQSRKTQQQQASSPTPQDDDEKHASTSTSDSPLATSDPAELLRVVRDSSSGRLVPPLAKDDIVSYTIYSITTGSRLLPSSWSTSPGKQKQLSLRLLPLELQAFNAAYTRKWAHVYSQLKMVQAVSETEFKLRFTVTQENGQEITRDYTYHVVPPLTAHDIVAEISSRLAPGQLRRAQLSEIKSLADMRAEIERELNRVKQNSKETSMSQLQPSQPQAAASLIAPQSAPAAAPVEEEEDANEVVDESGLDADEISTIMTQANVSRAKAVKALRKNKNIVDAILELTP